MRQIKNCLSLVLIQLFLCLTVGCQDNHAPVSFLKVETERTKLINGIESYQSVDEFRNSLSRGSFQWEESEDKPSPKGRPPYNIHVITIKSFSHLGLTGELVVTFFNNRLMATTFYPLDAVKYVAAVEKKVVLRLSENKKAKLLPHTCVRVAEDYNNRVYVDWSDIRLDQEHELWIKKYS
jgi:hypothetical protein